MKNARMKPIILLFLLMFILTICMFPVLLNQQMLRGDTSQDFLTSQNYSALSLINITGYNNQSVPSIALDSNGDVHVVFSEEEGNATDVIYVTSKDTFNSRMNVSKGIANVSNLFADIGVDTNGKVHVIWLGSNNSINWQLYYSNDGGSGQFGTTSMIAANVSAASPPKLEIGTDNVVHVVWEENLRLYYANSSDSFSSVKNVSNLPVATYNWNYLPEIAIDSNNIVHVSWYNLWFNYTIVSFIPLNFSIAVHNGFLYANSSDDFQNHINVTSNNFTGYVDTTGLINYMSNLSITMREYSDICVTNDGNVHITWMKINGTDETISYANKTDNFLTNTTIFHDNSSSLYAAPYKLAIEALANDTICIAWSTNLTTKTPKDFDIYLNVSINGFNNTIQLTDLVGNDTYQTFCVDDNDYFHMVWQDNTENDTQVYYLKAKFGPLPDGDGVTPIPFDLMTFFIIIASISIGAMAIASGATIVVWKKKKASSTRPKIVKKTPKSLGKSVKASLSSIQHSKILEELEFLEKNPISPELIKDPALKNYLSGSIVVLSPSVIQRVDKLQMTESEKLELLSELGTLSETEASELLTKIESSGA
ncbi:MAG: hypothetical protein ACTSSI_17675 [Candidatus Helarchaeota archaeon]